MDLSKECVLFLRELLLDRMYSNLELCIRFPSSQNMQIACCEHMLMIEIADVLNINIT